MGDMSRYFGKANVTVIFISNIRQVFDFSLRIVHYENLPMQYTEISLAVKIEDFDRKNDL